LETKCVQNRAARLEDFVEEDEFNLNQLARRDPSVFIALES
jgi:hypothetical protein